MNDILVYCRNRMGIRGPIRLRIGEEGTAPVVCGLINPVIVVPAQPVPTLRLRRHLRDVLFHELAHVKRHDLWVNLAQNVLQVLYFYNPLLLVINRRHPASAGRSRGRDSPRHRRRRGPRLRPVPRRRGDPHHQTTDPQPQPHRRGLTFDARPATFVGPWTTWGRPLRRCASAMT